MAIDKQYTVTEAAEILRITTRTLFTWIYTGKVQAAKVGRKWLITDGEIQRIIQSGSKQD